MTPYAIFYLLVPLFSAHHQPVPHPLVGDELPAGAVARLGPDACRYAGFVNVLHNAGPTVWYAPDGKRIAVTSSAGVYVWDTATGKRLLWVPSDGRVVAGCLGLTAGGDVIVDCRRKWDDSGNGVFRLDPVSGKVLAKFQPAEERRFVAASPDGKVVFSFTRVNAYETETVANELDTGKELWRRKTPLMSWMRVSPDGSRVVAWTSRGQWEVEVLDAATGKTVGTLAHKYTYTPSWTGGGVAVGPKAETVVAAHGWDRGFSIFRLGTEKPAWQAEGTWHENAFLTPDGKKAVLVRGGAAPTSRCGTWPGRRCCRP